VKAEKPELIVSGALTVKDFEYELKVILSRPGEKKDELPFSFGDPSALLKNIITEITRSILARIERPELKISTFTDRWGAFEQFYEGEQAWDKLDITKASEKLRAALVYDNNFVLAKVRLAQVVLFNGSRLEAQELIHSVRPHLSLLSRLDSLRVEAIQARLEGDLFKEISILQDIYNTFPNRISRNISIFPTAPIAKRGAYSEKRWLNIVDRIMRQHWMGVCQPRRFMILLIW